MAFLNTTKLENLITSLLPPEWVRQTARTFGVIQRDRSIDMVQWLYTLVLGFGTGTRRNISALRRQYAINTGIHVVPSSYYDRFNGNSVLLLRAAVQRLFSLAPPKGRRLRKSMRSFVDILVTDATVVRLWNRLHKWFPATTKGQENAALKLHLVSSIAGEGHRKFGVTGARVNERKKLRIGSGLKDHLLIFDLGYFKLHTFYRIDQNGGFFLSRLRSDVDVIIRSENRSIRGNRIRTEGESLHDILPRMKRKIIDWTVETNLELRKYRSRSSLIVVSFRVVGIRNDETGKYHIYITNIPSSMIPAEEIQALYACRWQIELIFKQLKSQFRLHQIPSGKKDIVEIFLLAAILTLMITEQLKNMLLVFAGDNSSRISVYRVAEIVRTYSTYLLFKLAGRTPFRHKRRKVDIIQLMLIESINPHLDFTSVEAKLCA